MDGRTRSNQQSEQKRKSKQVQKRRRRRPSRHHKQNEILKKVALERIDYLMGTAVKIYSKNSELAKKYVDLARRYSMSSKVQFPSHYKKLICHKCKGLLIPGVSSRHRIQSRKKRGSRYIVTCLNCDNVVHLYFKQKKSTPK